MSKKKMKAGHDLYLSLSLYLCVHDKCYNNYITKRRHMTTNVKNKE